MTNLFTDFDLGAVLSGITLTDTAKPSAFQSLGTQLPNLSLQGAIIPKFTGLVSQWTAEGAAKPVSGTNGKIKLIPGKLAAIVVETEEAWTIDGLANAIATAAPTAHAKGFDYAVAGITDVPDDAVNFSVVGDTTNEATIGAGSDSLGDFLAALGLVEDGNPTGAVLTTGMVSYLMSQTNGVGGRALNVQYDFKAGSGSVEGLPFYTITSADKFGFVGDYSRYFWGQFSLNDTPVRIATEGIVTDTAGTVHNLVQDNKIAVIHEVFVASGVSDLNDFVKITPASES